MSEDYPVKITLMKPVDVNAEVYPEVDNKKKLISNFN